MKQFVNYIFYFGFLLTGGAFIIASSQFIAYNGLGEFFEYIKPQNVTITSEIDSLGLYKTFHYNYEVKNKEYNSKQKMYIENISKNEFYEENMVYNKTFPSFTYVGKNTPRVRNAIGGIIISTFFFIFLFLIYKFADLDKWIGVYTRGEYKSSKK